MEKVTTQPNTIMYGDHRVVAIEYHRRRPFSVVTERYGYPSFWDFEHCTADKTIYYHESGCGGDTRLCLHKPADPGEVIEFWSCTKVVDFKGDALTEEQLKAWGYRRLKQPRLIAGSRNPFEAAEEGDTIWCGRCNTFVLNKDPRPCKHMEWEEGKGWVYEDGEPVQ